MGFLDSLFDKRDDTNDLEVIGEPNRVLRYYFVDTDPGVKDSILDFQLIFGPHLEREGWGILRANTALHFDEEIDWKIVIYENGSIIHGDPGFQARLGRIGDSGQVEDHHHGEFKVMDFPRKFVGRNIPKRSDWSDEELKQLTISLGISDKL